MPREDQIILIESQPPIRAKKIFYFKDRMFKSRLLPKIKIPKQEPYMPDHASLKSKKDADSGKTDDGTIEGANA